MPLKRHTVVARRLRRDATEAEKRLWRALREAMPDRRFRRQHHVGPFIADFACPSKKPAIEVDGGQHAIQVRHDLARTEQLALHGYRVLRFWNNDVLANIAGVIAVIEAELSK